MVTMVEMSDTMVTMAEMLDTMVTMVEMLDTMVTMVEILDTMVTMAQEEGGGDPVRGGVQHRRLVDPDLSQSARMVLTY